MEKFTVQITFLLHFLFLYWRQDSNLRDDYVIYNIESVVTSATSRRQQILRFYSNLKTVYMSNLIWSVLLIDSCCDLKQSSLLNGTLSGIVPNHRTLLKFELHQGSFRNISEADFIADINQQI